MFGAGYLTPKNQVVDRRGDGFFVCWWCGFWGFFGTSFPDRQERHRTESCASGHSSPQLVGSEDQRKFLSLRLFILLTNMTSFNMAQSIRRSPASTSRY